MCNVSESVNCTNFNLDLALGVPARGNRYSSKSPPTDCDEGNVNKQTSLSSTSSYTIRYIPSVKQQSLRRVDQY